MTMPRPRAFAAFVVVAGVALAGTSACGDDPVAPESASQTGAETGSEEGDEGSDTSTATTSEAGVTALISTTETDDGTHVVDVRFEPEMGEFSSYQAELRFPEATEIAASETPKSDYHVVNADLAEEEGRVRVAGFAPDGFSSPPRVRLELASDKGVDADALELDVEVAGTAAGEQIDRSEIQVRVDADTPPSGNLERTRRPSVSGSPRP